MERTLIADLHTYIDQEVTVSGSVDVRRDHGKLIFIDLRDRSGKIQMVANPKVSAEAHAVASETKPEWIVSVTGKVNKRPEKMVNADIPTGDIELEITGLAVLSRAEELPFERETEVNLDTLLDYRPLTLRSQRERNIFTVQATLVNAYRNSLIRQGFTEFQAPGLVGGDAEGGSAVFKVQYHHDKIAHLATSPQLYKQIMVGAFERVLTVTKVFRAEKSATTRHLSESTQMDFEMGFIDNETDVMAVLENVIRDTMSEVLEKHVNIFTRMKVEPPLIPEEFPVLTLAEVHEKLGVPPADDMEPEHERNICEWARKEYGSDFVFITRFPTSARAFYTMTEDGKLSRGFDLLFKGLEINSGAQRIHDYNEMVARIKERGMNPEMFQFYLQAFKYGMPPHGGCSTGLERLTARLLDLPNVKEASAFPRDMNRIDTLLSQ